MHILVDEWLKMVESRPIPAASGEPYDMEIVAIDVTGTAATVKVQDVYHGLRCTDYPTLVQGEDRGLIVNNTWHHDASENQTQTVRGARAHVSPSLQGATHASSASHAVHRYTCPRACISWGNRL